MTGEIQFGNSLGMSWSGGHRLNGNVHFTITMVGHDGPIDCLVTADCINDHCGNPGALAGYPGGNYLDAAMEHFDAISDRIRFLAARGRFEPDGSIVLRTSDWDLFRS